MSNSTKNQIIHPVVDVPQLNDYERELLTKAMLGHGKRKQAAEETGLSGATLDYAKRGKELNSDTLNIIRTFLLKQETPA